MDTERIMCIIKLNTQNTDKKDILVNAMSFCYHYDMHKKIESARDKEKSALQNKCQGKNILPVCHLIDNSFPNTNSTTIDKS